MHSEDSHRSFGSTVSELKDGVGEGIPTQIRSHLGRELRALYADALAEGLPSDFPISSPVSTRPSGRFVTLRPEASGKAFLRRFLAFAPSRFLCPSTRFKPTTSYRRRC